MLDIQDGIEAIAKERQNKEQNFMFRSIDDVYNLVFPLFKKNRVFTTPDVISSATEFLTVVNRQGQDKKQIFAKVHMRYTLTAEDGSSITGSAEGQALDYSDKAMNKAMSFAHKVFLIQTFNIPVKDNEDGDSSNHEVGRKVEEIPDSIYIELHDQIQAANTREEVTKVWNDNIKYQKNESFRDLVSKRLGVIKNTQKQ